MKIAINTIIIFLVFLAVIPGIASVAIMYLWNTILVPACGYADLGIWQSAGIFILGQILSGGFILGLMAFGGSLHKVLHHPHEHWGRRWHSMTEEERKEFIARRRSQFGHHHAPNADDNAAR